MPEGLSATEVGKEIGEHAKHTREHGGDRRRDRLISVLEALLLSVVTIVAAWSGYSAAKWGTESSLNLAKASATRTKANRSFQESLTYRTADAILFNAWFAAYLTHDPNEMRVAAKRFRPEFRAAFVAWLATHPFSLPNAPWGRRRAPVHPERSGAGRRARRERGRLLRGRSEGRRDKRRERAIGLACRQVGVVARFGRSPRARSSATTAITRYPKMATRGAKTASTIMAA